MEAYHCLYQYIGKTIDQFANLEILEIDKQGSSWYNCLNMSRKLRKDIYLHIAGSVTYADNIPRKQQFVLAMQIAPFYRSRKGFFSRFRIELAYLSANFADAGQGISGPTGFLYWQWQWGKGKKK